MAASKSWTDPPSTRSVRIWNRKRALCSLLCATLALPLFPHTAAALPDDACIKDERCKEHYNKAFKYYKEEYFEEALGEFQAAYSARQMPLLLVNIGRTLQKLGRPKEALGYYERFFQAETKPDAETKQRVTDYMTQARALAGSEPPKETPPDPAVAAVKPAAVTPAATPKEEPPVPGKNLLIAGGVVAGVGLIGIITGAALYAQSSSAFATFQGTTNEFDKLAARDSAQKFGTISTVSYVVGIAGLIGGAALLGIGTKKLLDHRKEAKASTAWLLPGVVPSTQGATAVLVGGF